MTKLGLMINVNKHGNPVSVYIEGTRVWGRRPIASDRLYVDAKFVCPTVVIDTIARGKAHKQDD